VEDSDQDDVKENGPYSIKNTVDEGSLKINFDKKVRFGEQLAFKTGGVPELFESELAKPIEFKNNFKTPQPSGKKTAKKLPKVGKGTLTNLMANKKKLTTAPPKQVQKPQTAAPLADFNLDTKPMKYFDAKLDPRFKADTSKATSSQTHKKGVMGQAVIEEDR